MKTRLPCFAVSGAFKGNGQAPATTAGLSGRDHHTSDPSLSRRSKIVLYVESVKPVAFLASPSFSYRTLILSGLERRQKLRPGQSIDLPIVEGITKRLVDAGEILSCHEDLVLCQHRET